MVARRPRPSKGAARSAECSTKVNPPPRSPTLLSGLSATPSKGAHPRHRLFPRKSPLITCRAPFVRTLNPNRQAAYSPSHNRPLILVPFLCSNARSSKPPPPRARPFPFAYPMRALPSTPPLRSRRTYPTGSAAINLATSLFDSYHHVPTRPTIRPPTSKAQATANTTNQESIPQPISVHLQSSPSYCRYGFALRLFSSILSTSLASPPSLC